MSDEYERLKAQYDAIKARTSAAMVPVSALERAEKERDAALARVARLEAALLAGDQLVSSGVGGGAVTLAFGSLFAGIGGFDLGFERAGMCCAWQVEINDFCRRVLAKHWPEVKRYGDIRECGAGNLAPVDVICGGFPCQPHSLAGKRRGAADDRDLWPEYRRIIAELRPRWVVGENVPGIRTTILDQVLSDLDGLDYTTGTIIVPACAFDAPHIRERVFVLAHAKRDGRGQVEQYICGAAAGERQFDQATERGGSGGWWEAEPAVGRVAHGVPGRVDRLRALGNAVVPQITEWIGRRIVAVEVEQ